MVVVLLQVERQHDSVPGFSGDGAFHQDKASVLREEVAIQVLLHVGTDLPDALIFSGGAKVDFGQGDVVGRRCVAHRVGHLLPVLRLRGELVTGDDRPFRQVNTGLGEKDCGRLNADCGCGLHVVLLPCK